MPSSPLRDGELPPPSERSPRLIGFDLLAPIGRGPRGTVWAGRTRRGADVAVKLLRPALTSQPGFVTRFEKETATLAALVHPNVAAVRDRGVSGGEAFLVSDLLPRGSVAASHGSLPLSPRRAVHVAIGVCEALDAAHRRGLVHRNLVAENVFVDEHDQVRVADFGLSMLEAEPPPGDVRADLRALGELLFRLVTGARQRVGVSPGAQVLRELPRLEELLVRAVGPEGQGYARASELALALRLALSGGGVGETDAATTASPRTPPKDGMSLSLVGRVIIVKLAGDADPAGSSAALRELGAVLGRPGPWRIAYELDPSTILDDQLSERLLGLHVRYQRSVEKLAFCSSRALGRASLLALASGTKRVPFHVVATREAMLQWLEAAS